jgi:hypothetical protein
MTELIATGISEEILNVLEKQGMPIRRSLDMDIPPFPRDITMIDDQELMTLSTKYMENFNFMRTQVACAELSETELENAYGIAEAKALLSKTSGKSTEKATMLKASVITDEVIEKLANEKFYAHAYKKMLQTMMDNLDRSYSLTSRELTRRTSIARQRY